MDGVGVAPMKRGSVSVLALLSFVVSRANGGEPSACRIAAALPPIAAPVLEAPPGVSSANLRAWVSTLSSSELRGRRAGTDDSRRAARLIAENFATLGAQVLPDADFCRPFQVGPLRDQNVVALVPPSGSAWASKAARYPGKWLVVGAHYDGLGVDEKGRIHPGADDNASGVAVLLEVARLLTAARRAERAPPPTELGVMFIAFGAEEPGLLGSAEYVRAPALPLERVVLMINVDMAGRLLGGNPGLGYEATGPSRRQSSAWVRDASRASHVGVAPMNLGDRSDSASFAAYVPSVFFSTTIHADYHQPTDTAERVRYDQVARATELVARLLDRTQS